MMKQPNQKTGTTSESIPITGIGSLPFASIDEAVSYVLETYDIPYLPQLPTVSQQEFMVTQAREGGYVALEPFLKKVPTAGILKLQMAGPLTAGVDITKQASKLLSHFKNHRQVWFIFDEPVLGMSVDENYFKRIDDMAVQLMREGLTFGIHSCNRWSKEVLSAFYGSSLNILSLDIGINLELLLSDVPRLLSYLERGILIWGIPWHKEISKTFLIDALSNKGLSKKTIIDIFRSSVLSPACGSALLSLDVEKKGAAFLKGMARVCAQYR